VKGLSRETRLLLDRGRGETLEAGHRARLKRAVFAEAIGASAAVTTLTAGWMATAAKVAGVLTLVGAASALVAVGTGTGGAARSLAPAVRSTTEVQSAPRPPAPSVPTITMPAVPADPVRFDTPEQPAAQIAAGGGSPAAIHGAEPSPSTGKARVSSARVDSDHASARPSTSPPASPHASEEPSVASSLQEEARLVREANAALEGGDVARSLALAEEEARRFPNGSLVPEGSAVHILALCQAGRLDQARTETGAFLSAHPEGPLSLRVRSSCGGAKP
jgi:hypothetical protein